MIVGIIIAVVVVLSIPFLWRLTANHRRLAALLDNNKVATELAEAVADMDFDGVAYLDDIQQPNRIQSAFIKIVQALRQYKSYMPAAMFVTENDDRDDIADTDSGTDGIPSSRNSLAIMTGPLVIPSLEEKNAAHTLPNKPSSRAPSSRPESVLANPNRTNPSVTLNRPLSIENVAVLSVFIAGKGVESSPVSIVSERYNVLLGYVLEVGTRHRGVPVAFLGDQLLLAYNAATKCAAKGYHAAMTAVEVRHHFDLQNDRVLMGLSGGLAQCGDVGPRGMRAFSVVGPCVSEAVLLQSLNNRMRTWILMSASLYGECVSDFTVRVRDVVYFSKARHAANGLGTVVVIEVADKKSSIDSDEWMYALDHEGVLAEYNAAMMNMILSRYAKYIHAFLSKVRDAPSTSAGSGIDGLVKDVERITKVVCDVPLDCDECIDKEFLFL
jgi:hypothetical protein